MYYVKYTSFINFFHFITNFYVIVSTFGSMSMNIVERSALESPKSLFAFTTHVTSCLFIVVCIALSKIGGLHVGKANLTVSSLSATVPRARLASCKVSSSSKQKVSHATLNKTALFLALIPPTMLTDWDHAISENVLTKDTDILNKIYNQSLITLSYY